MAFKRGVIIWGFKKEKGKSDKIDNSPVNNFDWLNAFEKETKDYYKDRPEKVSEFFEKGEGKDDFD